MYLGCRFYPFVYVEFSRIPLEKKWLTYISMYHQLSNSGGRMSEVLASVAGCLRKPVSERAHACRQTPAAPCRRRSHRGAATLARHLAVDSGLSDNHSPAHEARVAVCCASTASQLLAASAA